MKTKEKNILKSIIIISLSIIILTIIIGGFITFNTYLQEESEKEQTNLKLESEKEAERERQESLSLCIVQAKTSRENLWNSNCTIQTNGDCTIPSNSGTVEWIEQRYQQDLDNCYQLYGN